ncbi:MAG: DUF2249 domain-containing protein [Deltaproteobacteria bacterium]|nr:DUF2249 domain-containing protein [Deltaproteobacteria bacterium]
MKITPQTKIIDMIKEYPELVDVLASYNSHFGLLKNPIMRRTFARLATVRHASKVAGVNLAELIKLLNNAIGETVSDADVAAGEDERSQADLSSYPVKDIIEQRHVRTTSLDVREVMKNHGEPFPVIMQAVAKVKQGEALVLETLFEPAPLYDVLKKKGFEHQTEVLADDHYKIWFYREAIKETQQENADRKDRIREEGGTVYLDVRGLEPPGPMAMILETMAKLDPSKRLVVQHERVPMFLYPKLDEKGYTYETQEIDQRNVKLIIKPKNH